MKWSFRYLSNPKFLHSLLPQFPKSLINPNFNLSSTQPQTPTQLLLLIRLFSSPSSHLPPQITDKHRFSRGNLKLNSSEVTQIVDLIKGDEKDLIFKLTQMNVSVSLDLVSEVFRVLNSERVLGLKFFLWVRETQVKYSRNSKFCSLIVDNLGWVEDFDTMLLILNDFSGKGICLMEKAFSFVALSSDSVRKVVEVLNKVGGSCRGSGVYGLIKMLCISGSYKLAVFVMEETERKTCYYNVVILEMCCRKSFEEAKCLLGEMNRYGCHPDSNSYNYIFSNLCKNQLATEACKLLDDVKESRYVVPDAITFEVIINYACKLGRLDFAYDFLTQMMLMDLEPRLTTHAKLIKGFFDSLRFHEAYKYVVDMRSKYKCSGNTNYSLLTSLHLSKGRVLDARDILVNMMEVGMKPNFPVFISVKRNLSEAGMSDLAIDLENRFSKFNSGVYPNIKDG